MHAAVRSSVSTVDVMRHETSCEHGTWSIATFRNDGECLHAPALEGVGQNTTDENSELMLKLIEIDPLLL